MIGSSLVGRTARKHSSILCYFLAKRWRNQPSKPKVDRLPGMKKSRTPASTGDVILTCLLWRS